MLPSPVSLIFHVYPKYVNPGCRQIKLQKHVYDIIAFIAQVLFCDRKKKRAVMNIFV